MVVPLYSYPLSCYNDEQWIDWLDTLTVIHNKSERDSCECRQWPLTIPERSRRQVLQKHNTPDNQILELPCGCRYLRRCLGWIHDRLVDNGEVYCRSCRFLIFRPWEALWLDRQSVVDLKELREEESSCRICLEDYDPNKDTKEKRSHPVRLECGHAFHRPCIQIWLAEANTCPCCRHELFPAWAMLDDPDDDEVFEDEEALDISQEFSARRSQLEGKAERALQARDAEERVLVEHWIRWTAEFEQEFRDMLSQRQRDFVDAEAGPAEGA